MKDYFKILEIDQTADDAAVKSAFRKLAIQYHPDKNQGNAEAEAKFKEINEAYEHLKDADKRRLHQIDLENHKNRSSKYDAHRANNAYSRYGASSRYSSGVDFDEILRDIRRSKYGSDPYDRNDPPRDAVNRNIELTYHITLEESFNGKETELSYSLPGKGSKTFKFKIPAGIEDGIKIRYAGKGDDAFKHVPPGDLYVKISVMNHPNFVRHGHNLATSTTIDYLDAMLGTEVTVPTIEGKSIKVKIPAGIHPGKNLRIAGKGMPTGTGTRGDMFLEIVLEPGTLTAEQLDLIELARSKRKS